MTGEMQRACCLQSNLGRILLINYCQEIHVSQRNEDLEAGQYCRRVFGLASLREFVRVSLSVEVSDTPILQLQQSTKQTTSSRTIRPSSASDPMMTALCVRCSNTSAWARSASFHKRSMDNERPPHCQSVWKGNFRGLRGCRGLPQHMNSKIPDCKHVHAFINDRRLSLNLNLQHAHEKKGHFIMSLLSRPTRQP